ncbi:hypothetical protein HO173_006550 [Letharia columbiana]|uniref:Uncharacterized protein n=1 Tax=Letharia columbiana TaxID=112416 RepID=A0A8H6FV91_9LECA|nr:uncharacterized protein HO173_006550 [Letharia columbiana]KAF6235354.1 hypothetical protein HO173_006550 [Letharia columbiana]
MAILLHGSVRLVLRRSAQRHQQIFSPTKRQKTTAADKPAEKSSTVSKREGSSIATPAEISPRPLWERLGPLSEVFAGYARAQRQRPWTTQFGTSLVVYLCGDLTAQYIDGEQYNPFRTLRHLTIGGISSIPSYLWFVYLGTIFNYPSKLVSLATKVVVNQIVFTPVFNSYFFGMQSLLSGDGFSDAWERIKRTVPTSYVNSWKLWPAVTAFNFTYILPQYRALFAGIVAVGWQSYLSWLNQRAANEEKRRERVACE